VAGRFSYHDDVLFFDDISEDYRNNEQEGSYGQSEEVYTWYMQKLGSYQ
jgi:hypothetical protein